MIGVYDTTKYGAIPFIYIGLLPLAFLFFILSLRKFLGKKKILYGLLVALLIGSFYFVPLNLFWHGMHAPNMFLFRYAFLLSFTVIMLAGFAWEKLNETNERRLFYSFIFLAIAFVFTYLLVCKTREYLEPISLILTLSFLTVYCVIFFPFIQKNSLLNKLCYFY